MTATNHIIHILNRIHHHQFFTLKIFNKITFSIASEAEQMGVQLSKTKVQNKQFEQKQIQLIKNKIRYPSPA